jgi:hypothetical protein
VARSGAADPLVALNVRYAESAGPFPQVSVSVLPSSGRGIDVIELELGVGPGTSLRLTDKVSLSGAILAGIHAHTYHLSTGENGARVDWALSAPLSCKWAFDDRVALEATVLAGLVGADREHRIGADIVWHRGPFWGGAIAGMTYGF